jgi:predicted DNA-binding protein
MKRKEIKLVTVSLRIEEQDKQKLESICKNEGSTKSEFLRKEVLIIVNNLKK